MGIDQGQRKILGQHPDTGQIFPAAIDDQDGALYSIDSIHAKVHEEDLYDAGHKFIDVSSSGGTAEILLKNPAGNEAHIRNASFLPDTAPGEVEIYEGTTVSADGTSVDEVSRNRENPGGNDLSIFRGPTITSDGTQLKPFGIVGGRKIGALGEDRGEEWALDADTNYLIRYTNLSSNIANYSWFAVAWYEP